MESVNVKNLAEYKKLPKSKREYFGLYKTPEFYEMNDDSYEDYWKQNYPVQFFIRNTFENLSITLSVYKEKLVNNSWRKLFPENKWARQVIPNLYADKPELIQDFLFACVIDFVEHEPIHYIDWDSDQKRSNAFKVINDAYKFAKHTYPARIKHIDELTTELYGDFDFNDTQKSNDLLREELAKLEENTQREVQEKLLQIIKIRNYLWT